MLNLDPPAGPEHHGTGAADHHRLWSLAASAGAAPQPTTAPGAGSTLNPGSLQAHSFMDGLLHCLVQSLDHVGRGMLLVGPGGQLLHANRQAQTALASRNHALLTEQGLVKARHARDQALLADALHTALQKGVRRLLTLGRQGAPDCTAGHPASAFTVALLPIANPLQTVPAVGMNRGLHTGQPPARAQAVLISLQQCSHCKNLAVPVFAREHGCTDAETEVLEALMAGQTPEAIAQERGRQLCTVRTQIAQLRSKTGTRNIRELLDRVAALPPMMVVVQ